ncbi:sulfite exporter TauE/SafE family protein [Kitasatospora sp. SUK 42]|uniref:sulfite exporter TauE/SafE family protein n=1 Tax=Kitasatospora sp. SUK 42 TaxID=1588882 RepID=UPI0018C9019F|nr:sulfite exporter TauE/SafE family protein [Kitasatospora sp. SUK 42]MBV2154858.1 sulfite exporter TauE/SafE family protein [Kitasatospora sp. SUK 42]
MNGLTGELVLGCVVLLGAAVQRLAGIGFALVAAPVLVLMLGPHSGVSLSNLAAGAISAVGLAGSWRQVRPATMLPLLLAAVCTVPAGAWVAAEVPTPVLLIGIGLLVSAAALLVIRGARATALRGVGGALVAGATSGFMNSAAGVGGPAVSLYALNSGWTAREFVPNAQLYGAVVNVFSLAAKGLPELSRPAWGLVAVALAGGTVIGALLTTRVPERRARVVVLGLALAGGLTTLVKGFSGLG